MPRAFLIKKKHSALSEFASGLHRAHSPKLFSPNGSTGSLGSPTSSTDSTSSSSPRNDENELATVFQSPLPKYSFDRVDNNQCLDLSMKSLLKETNTLNEKSNKIDFPSSYSSTPLQYQEPYMSYQGKFAKIAGFLRTREGNSNKSTATNSNTAFAPSSLSPFAQSPAAVMHHQKAHEKSGVSSSLPNYSKPINYSAAMMENVSTSCSNNSRLPPYSINWSEHFSVNKLISPTPSSHGSDDSGRGSEHSEEMHSLGENAGKYGGKMTVSSKKSDRYHCPDCNKSYSTQSGLAKHQEFHCSSQVKKSFSCKHCEKVYVSLGALKMHIRTHTLPCKCKLCGKAFSRPWLLQGHLRTHTGEKPFACQYCNRAFADRSNLRAHLQTHSVVKKYNCKTCSRTFSRMSLLLKHEDNGCTASSRGSLSPHTEESMEH